MEISELKNKIFNIKKKKKQLIDGLDSRTNVAGERTSKPEQNNENHPTQITERKWIKRNRQSHRGMWNYNKRFCH